MQWLNEPVSWQRTADTITVSVDPATDFWRETGYGYIRDSGHIYGDVVAGDLDVSVRVRGTFSAQFDQAGIMLRVDDRTWLKTGMEFFEGRARLSTVLTLGQSSWMVTDLPEGTDEITIRATRRGDAVEVRYLLAEDGPAELAALVYLPPGRQLLAGVMCAAPEGPGFGVTFADLYIAAAEWGSDAQPADGGWAGEDSAWREEAPGADAAGWEEQQPRDGEPGWRDDQVPDWARQPAEEAGLGWSAGPEDALDELSPAGASRDGAPPAASDEAASDESALADAALADAAPDGALLAGTAQDGAAPGSAAFGDALDAEPRAAESAGDDDLARYGSPPADTPPQLAAGEPGGSGDWSAPGALAEPGEFAGRGELTGAEAPGAPGGPDVSAGRGTAAEPDAKATSGERGKSRHRKSRKDRKSKESAESAAPAWSGRVDLPDAGLEPLETAPGTAGPVDSGPADSAPGLAALPGDAMDDDTSPGGTPGGFTAAWSTGLDSDAGPGWTAALTEPDGPAGDVEQDWPGPPGSSGRGLEHTDPPEDRADALDDRFDPPEDGADALDDRFDPPVDGADRLGDRADPPSEQLDPLSEQLDPLSDPMEPLEDHAETRTGWEDPLRDQADPLRDTDPGGVAQAWLGAPAAADDTDLSWATPIADGIGTGPYGTGAPGEGAAAPDSAAADTAPAAGDTAAADGHSGDAGPEAEDTKDIGPGGGAGPEDGVAERPEPDTPGTPRLDWLAPPGDTGPGGGDKRPDVDPAADWERLVAGSRATAWTPARHADVSDDSWPGPPLVAREQAMNGNTGTPPDTGAYRPRPWDGTGTAADQIPDQPAPYQPAPSPPAPDEPVAHEPGPAAPGGSGTGEQEADGAGQEPAAADASAQQPAQEEPEPDSAETAPDGERPAAATGGAGRDQDAPKPRDQDAPKPTVPEPTPGRSGPFPVLSRWARSRQQQADLDAPPDPADEWISLLTADSDD
jgi:regulation of enolase protein 1 (concanavalin A-like superfamily)